MYIYTSHVVPFSAVQVYLKFAYSNDCTSLSETFHLTAALLSEHMAQISMGLSPASKCMKYHLRLCIIEGLSPL